MFHFFFYLERPSMLQCIKLMRSENNKDIRNLSLFLINDLCLYKWKITIMSRQSVYTNGIGLNSEKLK